MAKHASHAPKMPFEASNGHLREACVPPSVSLSAFGHIFDSLGPRNHLIYVFYNEIQYQSTVPVVGHTTHKRSMRSQGNRQISICSRCRRPALGLQLYLCAPVLTFTLTLLLYFYQSRGISCGATLSCCLTVP
jgi:hypothetical protein